MYLDAYVHETGKMNAEIGQSEGLGGERTVTEGCVEKQNDVSGSGERNL